MMTHQVLSNGSKVEQCIGFQNSCRSVPPSYAQKLGYYDDVTRQYTYDIMLNSYVITSCLRKSIATNHKA